MKHATRFAGAAVLAILASVACSQTDTGEDTYEASSSPTVAASSEAIVEYEDFTLTDISGNIHTLSEYIDDGQTVVLEWFNPDCPFVKAYYKDSDMPGYYDQIEGEDVVWLAINSGAPGKQGAGQQRNLDASEAWDMPYPVLLDESGEVGKAYDAKTTPHMFVITPDAGLIYAGAIDDSHGRGARNTNFVLKAIQEHRAGKSVSNPAVKSFGCSVKYSN